MDEARTRPEAMVLAESPISQDGRQSTMVTARFTHLGRLPPSRRRERPGDTLHGIEYARLWCATATDRVAAFAHHAHRVLARAHATRRRHRARHALPGLDAVRWVRKQAGQRGRLRTPCATWARACARVHPQPATNRHDAPHAAVAARLARLALVPSRRGAPSAWSARPERRLRGC